MKKPSRIVVALLLLVPSSLHVNAATKPNIVVFISDDHSQLDSWAYGSTEVRTPNMATLAAEGLKFTRAFVASPSCGPIRATTSPSGIPHSRPTSPSA